MHITGKSCTYELVIGLEVHAQIETEYKLFSAARANFIGDKPNANLDLLDLALPGVLPVVNMDAIYQCVRTGIALNGTINKVSSFDRKNYFYPDLPSGYQITQFDQPLVQGGYIDIQTPEGHKRVHIDRIHLEQDAGKLMHAHGDKKTYVDLNRHGVPLMEIVSNPDIKSPQEAVSYLKKLRILLRHIGASNADMEKGSFRCDVNISLKPLAKISWERAAK
jgi:aspartyl-tRNA(Asn)/glutamyl-tRNA(Gln) amidotransferase subunit B